jgi:hypothetical protein
MPSMETKMIKLYVVWGNSPEVNYVPCEYQFDTKEQADAFLFGLSEAHGWNSSASFSTVKDAEQYIHSRMPM